LARIVIEEWDPVTRKPTGYDVEILHTQTQTVKETDEVKPAQPIGTQGDVGAKSGAFHAHVQVVRSDDKTRTPLNPMRHLFEYHHPGEPIPPLPQFEPLQVPPREKRGAAAQPGNQGQLAPSGVPASNDAPAGVMSSQRSPGTSIPGAEGPTVIGGPGPIRPLVPPASSRLSAPAQPTTPAVDPTLPPLHFAPETPRRVGLFEGLFRSDTLGSPRVSSAADGRVTSPSIPPTPTFGAPNASIPATSSAVSGSAGQIGDGNGIGDWWKGVAPAASSNFNSSSLRGLPSPMPHFVPVDPKQPSRAADASIGVAGSAPSISAPTASPAASGIARPPSTGNPVWDWWNGLVADVDAISRRNGFGGLNTPMLGGVPAPPTQPVFDSGLPGMLQRAGAFDPPAGGLLGRLLELERTHPDDDGSA
jgi:hypothetical protein